MTRKGSWFNYTEDRAVLETLKCPHCKKLMTISEISKSKVKVEKL